jgi:vacuolar-type H+-ATPase subunit I/STV1
MARKPTAAPPERDYLSSELALLHAQRRATISSCDFMKTRVLDSHIDRLQEELAVAQSSAKRIETGLLIDLKKEAIRAKATQLLQAAQDGVLQAQSAHQERLARLRAAHGEELARHGEQYAAALELETTRANPNAEHLKLQAQFNANSRNYATAEALMQAAADANRERIANRQAELKQLFDVQRSRIVDRHRREIEVSQKRLQRDVQRIKLEYEREMTAVKHSFGKTGTNLRRELTDEDYAFLSEFVLRTDANDAARPQKRARSRGGTSEPSSWTTA